MSSVSGFCLLRSSNPQTRMSVPLKPGLMLMCGCRQSTADSALDSRWSTDSLSLLIAITVRSPPTTCSRCHAYANAESFEQFQLECRGSCPVAALITRVWHLRHGHTQKQDALSMRSVTGRQSATRVQIRTSHLVVGTTEYVRRSPYRNRARKLNRLFGATSPFNRNAFQSAVVPTLSAHLKSRRAGSSVRFNKRSGIANSS